MTRHLIASLVLLCQALAVTAETTLVLDRVVLRLVDDSQATALSAGVVTHVLVDEGAIVRQGQLLAQLDDAEQRVTVATAGAEARVAQHAASDDVSVRYAEKSAEAARAELRRSQESVSRFAKSVSQSQLDVERLAIQQAELEAEKARHAQRGAELEAERAERRLDAAKLLLDRRRVTAPIDGLVVETAIRTGEWIEPGQPAFRVVSTKRLKAEGFLNTERRSAVAAGQAVRVLLDDDRRVSGEVTLVSPENDPVTGQARLVALIDNTAGLLRPGMQLRLEVLSPAAKPATDTLGSRRP